MASMALHQGRVYHEGNVSIGPPVRTTGPVDTSGIDWYAEGERRDDVYYFSVFEDARLVGEIFLHDIGADGAGEALIGYGLFQANDRGRGLGTKALLLLQRYVVEETELEELFIITSADNVESRRIAQKCEFALSGAPRENPDGLFLTWKVPRPADPPS
jgi:RimJ/RimL family protein N-acetyltransferase